MKIAGVVVVRLLEASSSWMTMTIAVQVESS